MMASKPHEKIKSVLKPDNKIEASTLDVSDALVKNEGANVKAKSLSNAALLKAGLKSNLSASEATTQLRVLCRKFAALTEKIKEETKVREVAEREVYRLRALLDVNASPVVASSRAETQAYVRELRESLDKVKRELRFEKEKNERVVSKALELEREKNVLLTAPSQQFPVTTHVSSALKEEESTIRHQMTWDKEQVQKIQSTLKLTIEELEEELSRKEEELQSCREQSQRDRARIEALGEEIRAKDQAHQSAREARRQLEADLQQAQTDITNELENVQRIHHQAQEDRALRDTLEQRLATLNEVNAALEQRSRALVRRLELSSALTQECQDLKLQLRDAEVKNEDLVLTIRKLKDEHFNCDTDWKVRHERVKEEREQLKQDIRELQEDIASLQTQNSLFSDWMLVRNENITVAQRDAPSNHKNHQSKPRSESISAQHKRAWSSKQEYNIDSRDSSRYSYQRAELDASLYPNSFNQNVCSDECRYVDEPDMFTRKLNSTCLCENQGVRDYDGEVVHPLPQSSCDRGRRTTSTTSLSYLCSAAAASSDHERLRNLMSRNRDLQQRLQQETMATQN